MLTQLSIQTDAEATIKRISAQQGVLGIIILGEDGHPLRSSFEQPETNKYAALLTQFSGLANLAVRDLSPSNSLEYVRIRSTTKEIISIPGEGYHIIGKL